MKVNTLGCKAIVSLHTHTINLFLSLTLSHTIRPSLPLISLSLSPFRSPNVFSFSSSFLHLSPLHNQVWFHPIGKRPSPIQASVSVSDSVWAWTQPTAKNIIPPPTPPPPRWLPVNGLNGTGHSDHRHTALKIKAISATDSLIHSLISTK